MGRLIIEGEASKLNVIRTRFRGFGVKFVEESVDGDQVSGPANLDPPSAEDSSEQDEPESNEAKGKSKKGKK